MAISDQLNDTKKGFATQQQVETESDLSIVFAVDEDLKRIKEKKKVKKDRKRFKQWAGAIDIENMILIAERNYEMKVIDY